MPQYFFIIRASDLETEDDPHGTNLPDLGAALSYAERTIREMQKGGKVHTSRADDDRLG
jgi:hypothetical protein